jgi:hypothetical protein
MQGDFLGIFIRELVGIYLEGDNDRARKSKGI